MLGTIRRVLGMSYMVYGVILAVLFLCPADVAAVEDVAPQRDDPTRDVHVPTEVIESGCTLRHHLEQLSEGVGSLLDVLEASVAKLKVNQAESRSAADFEAIAEELRQTRGALAELENQQMRIAAAREQLEAAMPEGCEKRSEQD